MSAGFPTGRAQGRPNRLRVREAERAQDPDRPLQAHGILGTLSVVPPEASPTPAAPSRLCGHAWASGAQAQPDEGPRTGQLHGGEDRGSESCRLKLGLGSSGAADEGPRTSQLHGGEDRGSERRRLQLGLPKPVSFLCGNSYSRSCPLPWRQQGSRPCPVSAGLAALAAGWTRRCTASVQVGVYRNGVRSPEQGVGGRGSWGCMGVCRFRQSI